MSTYSKHTSNTLLGNRNDASKASDLVLLLAHSKADAIMIGDKIPSTLRHEILLTADQAS